MEKSMRERQDPQCGKRIVRCPSSQRYATVAEGRVLRLAPCRLAENLMSVAVPFLA
jgi:hypothetical protein